MMGLLASGSGWESLQGGDQDSGGTKFVKQIGWRNEKNGPKMQNWKMESQVAKTGKNYKWNYADRHGLLPDTTWSASGRYLRGGV